MISFNKEWFEEKGQTLSTGLTCKSQNGRHGLSVSYSPIKVGLKDIVVIEGKLKKLPVMDEDFPAYAVEAAKTGAYIVISTFKGLFFLKETGEGQNRGKILENMYLQNGGEHVQISMVPEDQIVVGYGYNDRGYTALRIHSGKIEYLTEAEVAEVCFPGQGEEITL